VTHYVRYTSTLIVTITILYFLFFLHPTSSHKKNTLSVICTTSMITDAVKKIAGDLVEVHGLMGPGVDPHTYRATEGDVHRLATADIIFYNGLHLEGKMAELFKKMSSCTTAVAVADAIAHTQLLTPPDTHGIYDPHIWFDVSLWQQVVKTIRDTLIAVDLQEEHQKQYAQRADDYLNELHMLHAYILAKTTKIPKEQRILVTAHDAFSYFGRAYNFQVVGLQGISTDSDISTRDVQHVVDFILTHKIPTIFVESSIAHRTLQAVQYAVQAHGKQVHIGEELFSDALGDPNTQAGTYIGMVRHNVDAIITGLLMITSLHE
jgi:manganese/zinc/iron transport system substrate-binding protein